MKAMRYHEFGPPGLLRLDEVAEPQPAAGEVLVQVAASSVNPVDWKIGEGQLRGIIDHALPFIPGMDFSGIIRALGPAVTGFSVGERVYGAQYIHRCGAYAEWIAVPVAVLSRAPASIPLTRAAAIPLAALTAWQALMSSDHLDLQAGQTVLIHGASGGLGTFAVQFARWRGARVIATASKNNHEFLRSLGADQTIDYGNVRFEEVVPRVDAVVDFAGGDVAARSIPIIRKGGALASAAAPVDIRAAQRFEVRASWVNMTYVRDHVAHELIGRLIDDGKVKVIVTGERPLAHAPEALTQSLGGHVRGKTLLQIADLD